MEDTGATVKVNLLRQLIETTTTAARSTVELATAATTIDNELSTTTTDDTFVIHDGSIVGGFGGGGGITGGTMAWAFFNSILLVFILGGNLMTIIAVRTCRRLRAIISNLFILSLAVSDFIVGLTLPYHFAFYLGSHLGDSHRYCLLRFFLIIFACCVSTFTLITIAIDRYIAIIYALHYRRYMTRRVACALIAINWTVGAVVATIPMFWNHWQTAEQCEFDQVLPSWYMVGFITPGFVLIWSVMLLLYWRIMREASKQACQLRNSILYAPAQRRHFYTDWKSIQIVVLIMGCFSLCWLPYFVVACAQIFGVYQTSPLLYKSAFSLAMTNSGLNPIIYAWKNKNFRKAFSLLIRCKSPNMHLMHMDGSFCSHYLPRQQSNMSIAIIAPHVSLAAKSDSYDEHHSIGNGNNNNSNMSNNNSNNNNSSSGGSNSSNHDMEMATDSLGVATSSERAPCSDVRVVTTVEVSTLDCHQPHHVDFEEPVTRPQDIETDIHSHTSSTNTMSKECAACRVCKSILLKSMQFRHLFTQRQMTNKMLM